MAVLNSLFTGYIEDVYHCVCIKV